MMINSEDNDYAVAMLEFEGGHYLSAMHILLPLARNGHAAAQCLVASAYQLGLGVEIDGKLAVHWYQRVVEQRENEPSIAGLAYNNLATIFTTGLPGINPDRDRAKEHLSQAIAYNFSCSSSGR